MLARERISSTGTRKSGRGASLASSFSCELAADSENVDSEMWELVPSDSLCRLLSAWDKVGLRVLDTKIRWSENVSV